MSPNVNKGEIVDRLLSKIALLEAKVQASQGGAAASSTNDDATGADESSSGLIKAIRGDSVTKLPVNKLALPPPLPQQQQSRAASPLNAATPPSNPELLSTLGDPDQQGPLAAAEALASSGGEWLASVGNWVRQRASSSLLSKPAGSSGAAAAAATGAAAAPSRAVLAEHESARTITPAEEATAAAVEDEDADARQQQAMGEALAEANARVAATERARQRCVYTCNWCFARKHSASEALFWSTRKTNSHAHAIQTPAPSASSPR
jgi:hypothetical protein